MLKKTISIIILFAILSISLISFISASDYIYAGDGMVIYPGYMIRTVCRPFMPCGVERINLPSYNYNNINTNTITADGDGYRFYKELSTPGLSEVMKDQESPTYNYKKYQTQNYNPTPSVIIYTTPHQYNNPTPIKHFANTYNTRNNYDSDGNWIGNRNMYRDYQPNSRTIVVYM